MSSIQAEQQQAFKDPITCPACGMPLSRSDDECVASQSYCPYCGKKYIRMFTHMLDIDQIESTQELKNVIAGLIQIVGGLDFYLQELRKEVEELRQDIDARRDQRVILHTYASKKEDE
jgi:uncharacterized Zn finger protein (UPF0148 family)